MLPELKPLHDALEGTIPNRRNFKDELVCLLNKYSKELPSNTSDIFLAEYLIRCLDNWNQTIQDRG